MFESIIATVLNRVLGGYVSNLEKSQLNIGIWKGDVVLRNLKLKKEALDKFKLPVDVTQGSSYLFFMPSTQKYSRSFNRSLGYIGELVLSIPWSNLKAEPVKAFLNNVYILISPKADTEVITALNELICSFAIIHWR